MYAQRCLLPVHAVVAVLAAGACGGAPTFTGRAADAEITFSPDAGLGGLEVRVGDVKLRPLAGAAALGKDGKPAPSIPLTVEPLILGDTLQLTITSSADGATGVDPGVMEGLGRWTRLDLSRYSAPYGQTWWPKTTYSFRGDFWFSAHWVMEESSASRWKALDQRSAGEGPIPAALHVVYEPDTAGGYLHMREVLELRFSRRLWDVVPPARQQPSEYRGFLAKSPFIDIWNSHHASQLRHALEVIRAVSRRRLTYYTILQNWEAGGWDALLPDSVWMPDWPPNPFVGTVDDLRELCELGKTMGRFGFRTNYRILREYSPSFKRGLAHYAVDASGKRLDYMRCADWLRVARRQDSEINRLFGSNACFTDQMTSGAAPWLWHDYAAGTGSISLKSTLEHQQRLARMMKRVHGGPLGSETLSDQHLIGEFVDTGDFAIKNGHARLFSPEFKLRRLHHLTGFHGMGLMYRFYEMPPFKKFRSSTTTFASDPEQLDDYRACEVLFGNGAYICYPYANWSFYLTECLLIGNLQHHYTLQPLRAVRYWHDGQWTTLEDFVKAGNVPNIVPWNPQTQAFGRVRVEYANGVRVVVNRLPQPFTVEEAGEGGVVLPRYGWVVWRTDGTLLAFSANWPGTTHRVDYLRDDHAELQYLDPRGEEVLGVSTITLWEKGEVTVQADPAANRVVVDGRTMALDLPETDPLTELAFDFADGLCGWVPTRGILSAAARDGALKLRVVAPGAHMRSPRLKVATDPIKAVEIRMTIRAAAVKPGGLYFTTEESPNIWNDKLVNFEVTADGEPHTYRLNVASHPKWKGQTLTKLRLDPLRGASEADVEIDFIRGVEE